jgi:hypothetical protein
MSVSQRYPKMMKLTMERRAGMRNGGRGGGRRGETTKGKKKGTRESSVSNVRQIVKVCQIRAYAHT